MWSHVGKDFTPRTTPATVRAYISCKLIHINYIQYACKKCFIILHRQYDLLTLLSDCHPSCRSCVGPLASDCLRCLKPEEALLPQFSHLQHGVCTAGCPAHSFLDHTKTCRGEYVRFLRIIILLYRCGSVPARVS